MWNTLAEAVDDDERQVGIKRSQVGVHQNVRLRCDSAVRSARAKDSRLEESRLRYLDWGGVFSRAGAGFRTIEGVVDGRGWRTGTKADGNIVCINAARKGKVRDRQSGDGIWF